MKKQINAMFILKKVVNCLETPMFSSSRKPTWAAPPSSPGPSISPAPKPTPWDVSLLSLLEAWLLKCGAVAACLRDSLGRVIIHSECINSKEASQAENADEDTNAGPLLSHQVVTLEESTRNWVARICSVRPGGRKRAAVSASGGLEPPKSRSFMLQGRKPYVPKQKWW